jgi:isopenicillin-N epimerase
MIHPDTRALFPLKRGLVYLDHGGYGVTPKKVMQAREKLLRRIEKAPRSFFTYEYRPAWQATRALVAQRFSIREGNLALIENATEGINSVLRSFPFQSGDEILTTTLTYGAIQNAATHIARLQGVKVVQADLRFPDPNPEQCVDAVRKALTVRTKMAILDHITSSTGMVLPIIEMTRICRAHDVAVLVDAAHAPGQVTVDINVIQPDWYVANLHKWYFVPRGCGFLWAAPARQDSLMPLVLSWDIGEKFPDRFDWTGTRDPTPWLCIPEAFTFMDQFGEEKVRVHNHRLVLEGAALLAKVWDVKVTVPECMIGSMVLVPLPEDVPYALTDQDRLRLQADLEKKFSIISCVPFSDHVRHFVRISAGIYNELDDFKILASAINAMRKN